MHTYICIVNKNLGIYKITMHILIMMNVDHENWET